jgi:hypothetical protein
MTIMIHTSPTADTRTCDVSKVSKRQLFNSSDMHICDVRLGMRFLMDRMHVTAGEHDHDKLSGLDQFHKDFRTGFKQTTWLQNHYKVNRHHLDKPEGVPDNVNLVDVMEHIVDCVMAGLARSGEVRPVVLPAELLQWAVENTVEMLIEETDVLEAGQ